MLFTRKKSNQLSPIQAADGARGEELVLVDVREHDERAQARPADSRHAAANVSGGMLAWADAGLPVESGPLSDGTRAGQR